MANFRKTASKNILAENNHNISALVVNSVSPTRLAQLHNEANDAIYKAGIKEGYDPNKLTEMSAVVASINKKAQIFNSGGSGGVIGSHLSGSGGGYRGTPGNGVKQAPELYSPLWLNSNLNLPRDKATQNAWCRSFFAINPFVQNCISLHSTYPISKLNIKCDDPEISNFFEQLIEDLDLLSICVQVAQEYFLLGEAFIYAELDETNGTWSRLLLQNPDYMIVKRSIMSNDPVIMIRPDDNLQEIVNSNKPQHIEQRKNLNQYIIDTIRKGGNIPVDNIQMSYLARRVAPYDVRGTGLPVSVFRQLMLFDKLRESKFAQSDNMINPMTLVKIGGPDYKATVADIEYYRDQWELAQGDKDFKLFTHDNVTVERNGYGQGIYDISGDITQLIKEIYIGLQVPPGLMDGGQDITYANAGVSLDFLRDRYVSFRMMLTRWIKKKIFEPISKIRNYYRTVGGQRELIIPDIEWNYMNLFDTKDYIDQLKDLAKGEIGKDKVASVHTLYKCLGLNWEDEQQNLRKEMVQMEILKKEQEQIASMSLSKLRELNIDEDDIPEVVVKEEGAGKQESLPGEDSGMPDLGGGGMPSEPGPPPGLPAPPELK